MARAFSFADISERMFNRPLAITREKAEIALGVIGPRLNIGSLIIAGETGDPIPIGALEQRAASARNEIEQMPGDKNLAKKDYRTGEILTPYEIWNGIAILKVRGSLLAENGLDPMSGATGYDGLNYKLRWAATDENVDGIIWDIDSPGGEVIDLSELCQSALEVGSRKPMRAIVRGQAASAGYALAACSQKITAADYSVVGSIGSIMMHADFSKKLEKDGIAVTMITSGEHKDDGSPFKPLGEGVQKWMQDQVTRAANTFIDHVAETRPMSREAVEGLQARFTSGAEALELGLVDEIMSWEDSLKEFAQQVNGAGASPGLNTGALGARSNQEKVMSDGNKAPVAAAPETDQAALDAARAEGHAEGMKEGTTAGTNAERTRVNALAEIDANSKISPELTAAIESGQSAGDFAIDLAKSGKAKLENALEGAKAGAVDPENIPEKGAANGAPAAVNRGEAAVKRMEGKHQGLPKKAA